MAIQELLRRPWSWVHKTLIVNAKTSDPVGMHQDANRQEIKTQIYTNNTAADSERRSVAWAWVFKCFFPFVSSFLFATIAASAVRKALRKEELKRMQKDLVRNYITVCKYP